MRELYDEYFYVPDDGKIRDKVMLARTALTVLIMLLCLFAMSITAYAYFSNDSTTHVSAIKTADFGLGTTVTNNDGTIITPNQDGTYTLLEGTYVVCLSKKGSASTGFCVINDTHDTDDKYHTQQIGVSGSKNIEKITFTLEISEQTTVKFTPHWGTSSCYGYQNDDNNPKYIKDRLTLPPASDQPQTPQTPPVTQDDDNQ